MSQRNFLPFTSSLCGCQHSFWISWGHASFLSGLKFSLSLFT